MIWIVMLVIIAIGVLIDVFLMGMWNKGVGSTICIGISLTLGLICVSVPTQEFDIKKVTPIVEFEIRQNIDGSYFILDKDYNKIIPKEILLIQTGESSLTLTEVTQDKFDMSIPNRRYYKLLLNIKDVK